MTTVTIESHDPATLVAADRNPNRMEDERYLALKDAIAKFGFLQPVLIRARPSGDEIVDGHHRVRAALDLNLNSVPTVRVDGLSEQAVEALRIGMNRLRGELDLAQVGEIMLELVEHGWKAEDLALTGFSADEIDDLLKATSSDDEDMLAQAVTVPDESETPPKPFVLEITFASRKTYAHARKVLKRAGNGDMALGLVRLLGEEASDVKEEGDE